MPSPSKSKTSLSGGQPPENDFPSRFIEALTPYSSSLAALAEPRPGHPGQVAGLICWCKLNTLAQIVNGI